MAFLTADKQAGIIKQTAAASALSERFFSERL
ncbi:hypothetical protein M495_06250 [Serratia liquefaciens ATCC 27592]|nr:hypothetical protein M495_06250 [Serratia liquefaciens ATCC 27592]